MPDPNGALTLEGLAQILRDHMGWTTASVKDLREEIGRVAAMVVQLTQVVAGQVDELAEYRFQQMEQRRRFEEYRQEVLRIYSRMEQHDARIEEMNREFRARIEQQNAEIAELRRDTRRILDAMERRGGDGGPREQ